MITVRPRPCATCPYRKDVPPGVWHESEYEKLIAYDGETWEQPPSVFMCHTSRDQSCAGWVGCHDMENNLAIRVNHAKLSIEEFIRYECPVPLFASGTEAAEHGMREPEEWKEFAASERAKDKLTRLRERRHARGTVVVQPVSGETGDPEPGDGADPAGAATDAGMAS